MHAHADRIQSRRTRLAAYGFSERTHDRGSAIQFADHRPESAAQRKLQDLADNSPRANQLRAYQEAADEHVSNTEAANEQSVGTYPREATIRAQKWAAQPKTGFSRSSSANCIQMVKGLNVGDEVSIGGAPPLAGRTGVITALVDENTYRVRVKIFGERDLHESLITPTALPSSSAPVAGPSTAVAGPPTAAPKKYDDPYVLHYEKQERDVRLIMADIEKQTIWIGHKARAYLKIYDNEEFALLCTYLMEMLNDKARKQMEGVAVTLRADSDRRKLIVEEVMRVIARLTSTDDVSERREALGDFFGWSIANQNFLESNNRGTYIMLVLLGTIFGVDVPPATVVLSREKAPFVPKIIKAQYMKMYETD